MEPEDVPPELTQWFLKGAKWFLEGVKSPSLTFTWRHITCAFFYSVTMWELGGFSLCIEDPQGDFLHVSILYGRMVHGT